MDWWAVSWGRLIKLHEKCWICAHAGRWSHGPGYWLVSWHLDRMAR